MTFNFLEAVNTPQATEAQSVQQSGAPAANQNSQAVPSDTKSQQTTTTATTEQPAQPNPQEGQSSMMPMIIMLVAMFVIMYFFMIRPQKKRQKQIQEMRNKLEVGSEVILASGIRGRVKDTNPEKSYMTIEISKGVCIDVDRNYVFTDLEQTMQR